MPGGINLDLEMGLLSGSKNTLNSAFGVRCSVFNEL